MYVYSPYKELEGDGMKFERTNENAPLISYTIKLVNDSTYLTKTLEVADGFLDNMAKIYERKNIFMQYGTQWLIYKFNVTKAYLEKSLKNCSTQNFHKFIYNEMLYADPTKLLPAFLHNRASVREAIIIQIPRKYPILLGSESMHFFTRNNGALNIFITPELYRDAKKSFVRILQK